MDAYEPRRRKFEQQTHSGTSSAGSMGAGGTGGSRQSSATSNSQSAGRTDDLLSGCVSEDQRAEGYQHECNAEALRQGMETPSTPRRSGKRQ